VARATKGQLEALATNRAKAAQNAVHARDRGKRSVVSKDNEPLMSMNVKGLYGQTSPSDCTPGKRVDAPFSLNLRPRTRAAQNSEPLGNDLTRKLGAFAGTSTGPCSALSAAGSALALDGSGRADTSRRAPAERDPKYREQQRRCETGCPLCTVLALLRRRSPL
jgi:hypothetical protein